MKVKFLKETKEEKIVEIESPSIILRNSEDLLDIIGNANADAIILYEKNLDSDLFNLGNKKLGDILQKLENYKVKFAVIGDFSKYANKSESLKAFFYETNRYGKYLFVDSLDKIKNTWNF